MMFEFEGLVAVGTLEFAKYRALVVADHVSLQSVHVRESLAAHLARLRTGDESYCPMHTF